MIVRIFAVCLDNVVIHVLDGKIGFYRAHPRASNSSMAMVPVAS